MSSNVYVAARPPIDHSYSISSSSGEEAELERHGRSAGSAVHIDYSFDLRQFKTKTQEDENWRTPARSTISSIDESEPPSPTSGPPPNFAEVGPGVYRSGFPRATNFDHLNSLGLKTILTLVPELYPSENMAFVQENNIRHFQIPIPPNKNPFDTIPSQDTAAALKILLDRRHHPVLVHCNKGKHRTGCVIGCYRKINDWTVGAILAEYRKYAGAKARVLDERFIELFDEQGAMATISKESETIRSTYSSILTPPGSVVDDSKDGSFVGNRERGLSKTSNASSTA